MKKHITRRGDQPKFGGKKGNWIKVIEHSRVTKPEWVHEGSLDVLRLVHPMMGDKGRVLGGAVGHRVALGTHRGSRLSSTT